MCVCSGVCYQVHTAWMETSWVLDRGYQFQGMSERRRQVRTEHTWKAEQETQELADSWVQVAVSDCVCQSQLCFFYGNLAVITEWIMLSQVSRKDRAWYPVTHLVCLLLLESPTQDWRDGSEILAAPRGPRFGSQHPYGSSHPTVIPTPRNLIAPSGL